MLLLVASFNTNANASASTNISTNTNTKRGVDQLAPNCKNIENYFGILFFVKFIYPLRWALQPISVTPSKYLQKIYQS